MTEDKTKTEGWENLNWEDKTTYTKEEVDAMKAKWFDTDPWAQDLLKKSKRSERALKAVWKIAQDKKHLVELHESDPKVAKIILDEYYGWQSIDEYKEDIWYKVDYNDPEVIKKLVSQQAKQEVIGEKIATQKAKFIAKLRLEWDELEAFEEAFGERQALKSFKVENLSKILEKAYNDIDADTEALKEYKKNQAIAWVMAWGSWGWGTWWNKTKPKTKLEETRSDVRGLFDKFRPKPKTTE